ncbi:MAG TPA: BlaI/MecI/CopY family transcriptional regulator, partial [Puia sp.]|nr:BlaI/MecI/CopY family transcriptional regulator [Puia sp.]
MEELTKVEERIMHIFWDLQTAFIKDIIDKLPDDPKPPYNTISSVVRILVKKGYVGFKAYGNTYQYFPVITK